MAADKADGGHTHPQLSMLGAHYSEVTRVLQKEAHQLLLQRLFHCLQ